MAASDAGTVQGRLPVDGMVTEAGQGRLDSGKDELHVQHGQEVQDEHGMIQMSEVDHVHD